MPDLPSAAAAPRCAGRTEQYRRAREETMARFHPASASPRHCALARRDFLFRMSAAALAVHPLIGCGGGGPTPRAGDTFYARDFALPQTQSAAQLSTWLESLHPEHHINGWYFMGSIGGSGAEFTLTMEHITTLDGKQPMRAVASYLDPAAGNWLLAGMSTEIVPATVSSSTNPWSFTLDVGIPGAPPPVSLRTLSGRFGAPGTEYLLQAALLTMDGTSVLSAQLHLRDRFGVIAQGQGTAAFNAGYLNEAQRTAIVNLYGGSLQAYLEATGDPMIDQGDFYYQLPLLDVVEFTIARDATVLASGTGGLIWCDYVAANYDELANAAYQSMTSNFFAIQLPQLDTSLMALRIDSLAGSLPTATLFDGSSPRAANGARNFAYSWPITGISIEPDLASRWEGPVTHNVYYLRYRIRLDSPQRHADFTVTMATANQEVPFAAEPTYAGLTNVTGTLDGSPISGVGFVEIWSGLKK